MTKINANLFLKGQYRTLNATRKKYVKKSPRTTSEGIEDVFVTVYKDTVLTNSAEKTIDKEDDKPLLSTPEEDIDWDSVSEDNIFYDYPEDVDQEERIKPVRKFPVSNREHRVVKTFFIADLISSTKHNAGSGRLKGKNARKGSPRLWIRRSFMLL